MQKIVNVIALASGIVSTAIIASGVYVYVNRDAIIDGVKSQAIEAVTGSLGGGIGGGVPSFGGDALPVGTPDLATPNDQASAPPTQPAPSMGLPVPSSPF